MLKPTIPFVDLRGRKLTDLARAYPDKVQALVASGRRAFGPLARAGAVPLLPLSDRASHSWLKRNRNPFLHEIETFAEIAPVRGVFTLNMAYEWGCSGGVLRSEEGVSLLRVLDWPLPGLGKHSVVVWMDGKAGDYVSVTWPGLSGVFQGLAYGRFTAAINQAPMRRHGLGFAGDWLKNRDIMRRQTGLPPAHLLRLVFEKAANYEQARTLLMQEKLAMPAIFLLAGMHPGEGCIIERLEDSAHVFDLRGGQRVVAANQFQSAFKDEGKGWRPRALDSEGRLRQCGHLHGHDLSHADFEWLKPPVINKLTRLCMMANARSGHLLTQGYEGHVAVTQPFIIPGQHAELPETGDFALYEQV